MINAAILLSAWSAAASDLYISSRFLFFLARCQHAPQFLRSLIRHPYVRPRPAESEDELSEEESDEDLPPVIHITRESLANLDEDSHPGQAEVAQPLLLSPSPYDSPDATSELSSFSPSPQPSELDKDGDVQVDIIEASPRSSVSAVREHDSDVEPGVRVANHKEPLFALPLNAVLVSASVGLLSFLGSATGNTAETVSTLVPYSSDLYKPLDMTVATGV